MWRIYWKVLGYPTKKRSNTDIFIYVYTHLHVYVSMCVYLHLSVLNIIPHSDTWRLNVFALRISFTVTFPQFLVFKSLPLIIFQFSLIFKSLVLLSFLSIPPHFAVYDDINALYPCLHLSPLFQVRSYSNYLFLDSWDWQHWILFCNHN